MGLDPERSTFVLQSEIPAIAELTFLFAMLIPFNKVMRNPSLKTEIETKQLGDTYSFGFPMYAVGQCADILTFRPELVPVGADQEAHIEMCRDVALKFNQLYCGVGNRVPAEEHAKAGGLFPIPKAKIKTTAVVSHGSLRSQRRAHQRSRCILTDQCTPIGHHGAVSPAPRSTSNCATLSRRQLIARCRGESPLLSTASMAAPHSSSALAILRWPRLAAICSAVARVTPPQAFTSAPARTRARTTSTPPSDAHSLATA